MRCCAQFWIRRSEVNYDVCAAYNSSFILQPLPRPLHQSTNPVIHQSNPLRFTPSHSLSSAAFGEGESLSAFPISALFPISDRREFINAKPCFIGLYDTQRKNRPPAQRHPRRTVRPYLVRSAIGCLRRSIWGFPPSSIIYPPSSLRFATRPEPGAPSRSCRRN